ncbi:hypothetical protein NDU88_005112 [Pleurodeles waltl]|uniref:Uncharacterized protein n=1 Tax=Pleurodeles waltl TaxID=8319 RepID=A0AAV7MBZ0_PLEWA|nr:hypothetical protein NDU88_005112 [Pleurodeles waltl]
MTLSRSAVVPLKKLPTHNLWSLCTSPGLQGPCPRLPAEASRRGGLHSWLCRGMGRARLGEEQVRGAPEEGAVAEDWRMRT